MTLRDGYVAEGEEVVLETASFQNFADHLIVHDSGNSLDQSYQNVEWDFFDDLSKTDRTASSGTTVIYKWDMRITAVGSEYASGTNTEYLFHMNDSTGSPYIWDDVTGSKANHFGINQNAVWFTQNGFLGASGIETSGGTTDAITFANGGSPEFYSVPSGTMEIWFKPYADNPGGITRLISHGGVANQQTYINVLNASINYQVNAEARAGSHYFWNDKWYHVAVTWDGTDRFLYVNGELQFSGTSAALPAQLSSYMLNGVQPGVGVQQPFRAVVDEFRYMKGDVIADNDFKVWYQPTGTFISSAVADIGSEITHGILYWSGTVSDGGTITGYLSADSGANWETVTNLEWHEFTNTGSLLKVKFDMTTNNGSVTPQVHYYATKWIAD